MQLSRISSSMLFQRQCKVDRTCPGARNIVYINGTFTLCNLHLNDIICFIFESPTFDVSTGINQLHLIKYLYSALLTSTVPCQSLSTAALLTSTVPCQSLSTAALLTSTVPCQSLSTAALLTSTVPCQSLSTAALPLHAAGQTEL